MLCNSIYMQHPEQTNLQNQKAEEQLPRAGEIHKLTGNPQKVFDKWTQSFDYGVLKHTKLYYADGYMIVQIYEKPSR